MSADVVTFTTASGLSSIESDSCYVVDGEFLDQLTVPDGVSCAKITILSDSRLLGGIVAHLPRPSFFAPRPAKR